MMIRMMIDRLGDLCFPLVLTMIHRPLSFPRSPSDLHHPSTTLFLLSFPASPHLPSARDSTTVARLEDQNAGHDGKMGSDMMSIIPSSFSPPSLFPVPSSLTIHSIPHPTTPTLTHPTLCSHHSSESSGLLLTTSPKQHHAR